MKNFLTASLVAFASLGFFNATAGAETVPDHLAKIAENVYSYGSSHGYFSMFVVTGDGVVVIESVSTQHATGLLQAIRAVTDQPVKYLLHSHNHWDHSSGGQVFKEAGAVTLAHIEAWEWMRANPGRDMAVPDESWGGVRKDITLGGTTIELHYLGMNHGLGMTVFRLPEQKVAYIADIVTPNRVMFSIVPDFNIREWERSLDEILLLDFDRAVYSHNEKSDPLQGGTKQDVADNLQFIRDLRAAIYAEFENGTNPMMVPDIVQLPQYKDWAMYDQWLAMNAWRLLLDDWMGPFPWRPDHPYQEKD
ncbi:MAG: MBL fold metallo-hydrolase [Candidatus Latescibacteria bacterium]|nr:MBL fold metallo-hydrolase [Candidatus Latescibacterota bacterium]